MRLAAEHRPAGDAAARRVRFDGAGAVHNRYLLRSFYLDDACGLDAVFWELLVRA